MSTRWSLALASILFLLGAAVIAMGQFDVLPSQSATAGIGGGMVGLGTVLYRGRGRRD